MCLDEICPFTTLTVHFHVKQHFEKNLCVMSFVSRLCQYCDDLASHSADAVHLVEKRWFFDEN